jgi:hypothetical protein
MFLENIRSDNFHRGGGKKVQLETSPFPSRLAIQRFQGGNAAFWLYVS